ncbi:MAG: NAD-dependent epimerase/dehydratase family protein [Pseudomonadota bacterium]
MNTGDIRRVGVTGASGFVGRAVLQALVARGLVPVALTRVGTSLQTVENRVMGDVASLIDAAAFEGLDAVIHLAARVHRMDETAEEAEAGHTRTNVGGTRNVAAMAAEAGLRRVVFCSSIKAMAERDRVGPDGRSQALTADDAPQPEDAYGRSKLAAERALWAVCESTGLEGVVIRPPLVHGPGVGGNLSVLMRAVSKGLPLPFSKIDNARSLVSVRNLADLLVEATTHPAAAGRTFLVSDGPPVSTPDLVRAIAHAMGRDARLLPLPIAWVWIE